MPGGGSEELGDFFFLGAFKSFSLNEHEKLFRTLELFC